MWVLLQSSSRPSMAWVMFAMTSEGTPRTDEPVSRMALQPSMHVRPMLRPSSKARPPLSNKALQELSVSTGTRVKRWGFWKATLSFQTKSPSESGAAPMHTEKAVTLAEATIGRLFVSSMAAMIFIFASCMASVASRPALSKMSITEFTDSLASVHAFADGACGGPTPMIASNAALEVTVMSACSTFQNACDGRLRGPMLTCSLEKSETVEPLPKLCCIITWPGRYVRL
mmetsp:Transcript_13582/g.37357  ORF Transcript_13582/g.37357 Transcript_13582/m.37357 type:complete len:229 (+) Transcript_13582:558-1244(+)